MIRLLGRKTSGNVQKVMWLLEELGLEYSREDYGRQFKNTSDQDYLEMNPTGKVPTVIDGGIVLRESNTILRYLAGKVESELLPRDLLRRAQSEIWMDWLLASLNTPFLIFSKSLRRTKRTVAHSCHKWHQRWRDIWRFSIHIFKTMSGLGVTSFRLLISR